MAVAVQAQTSRADKVRTAAARSYVVTGYLVVETSVGDVLSGSRLAAPCLFVGALDTIEIVLDSEAIADVDWEGVRTAVDGFTAEGLETVVLVPSVAMGEAHRELRGSPASLQQWWLEAERVCFGKHENL